MQRDRDGTGRRRRTWGQRSALAFGCVAAAGLLASAAGLTYVLRKYERLPRVELSGVLDEEAETGEPQNYLIVGIDNADDLPGGDPVRIGRDSTLHSDTIMILRTDPASRRAALLSLPRDLFVPIPGTGTSRRINVAIEQGGAPLLIRTIGETFGIPIHHYVQVDFASFRGLVEAIDGVPVYVPRPARDEETGLDLPDVGCRMLDPTEALAYVRSRHYEELIGSRWVEDPRSDIGRIARQQDFIRRALSRAVDRGARNPGTLDQLIDVGLSGVTVDSELTAGDIFALGTRFRSFDPDNLQTYSVSGTPDVVNGAAVLRLIEGPETEAPSRSSGAGPPMSCRRRACGSPCTTAPASPARARTPPPRSRGPGSTPPWPATSRAAGPGARSSASRRARRPPRIWLRGGWSVGPHWRRRLGPLVSTW